MERCQEDDLFENTCVKRLWNRNFILSCGANFMTFFSFYLLLPILPIYLSEEFDASKSAIGSILSLYAVTCLVIRPFSGFMVDSFPRKRVLVISYAAYFIFFGVYPVAATLLLFTIARAMHGFAFGALSVSNSTVAIDVMPSEKRGSGIAYFGVANNLAMCIGPAAVMIMYQHGIDFHTIFIIAFATAGVGLAMVSKIRPLRRDMVRISQPLSFDRFWLPKAWRQSLNLIFVSFAYGLLTTYLAIYGKEELGLSSGSGVFFLLLALGIILSRLFASHWINKGYVTPNITLGTIILCIGYAVFTFWKSSFGYYSSGLIIGLGQGMFLPAYQTMFINLAPNSRRGTANSTYTTSWDVGAGLGILAGGAIVDHAGYHVAFLSATVCVAIGLAIFQMVTSKHFKIHRLR